MSGPEPTAAGGAASTGKMGAGACATHLRLPSSAFHGTQAQIVRKGGSAAADTTGSRKVALPARSPQAEALPCMRCECSEIPDLTPTAAWSAYW